MDKLRKSGVGVESDNEDGIFMNFKWFLGAATGSPYIVFISTSGMLRSSDIYIYI